MNDPAPVPSSALTIPWRRLVVWFVASRLLIFTIAGLSLQLVAPGRFATTRASPLDWLIRWDAGWYLGVITHGYDFDPTRMSNVNFLPAYPLSVRAISWLLPSPELAGYLVSNAYCFAAAALLWRFALEVNQRVAAADGAVLFFLFGPVSFFFSTLYAEATFIFFALATLLAARRRRWLLAGLCGIIATLSRSVGVLLIVALAVEFLQQHPWRDHWRSPRFWGGLASCALPIAGVLIYSAYMDWKFDEPRA